MSDVFISYSRRDGDFVRQLQEYLQERNQEAWLDTQDIPPSAQWLVEICSAIDASDTFVFVISPDSVVSDVCRQEAAYAEQHHKRIVPILRRDVDVDALPEAIASRHWLLFQEQDNFESASETLLSVLATDLDFVRAHTRLLVRAREWEAKGQDSSYLLRGYDLQEAEEWLVQSADKDIKPTLSQTLYIRSSRQAATKRQRITIGAVTFGFIVAIILAGVALYQRQVSEERRKIALSRQLAVQADALFDDQPDLASLLALEANNIYDTFESRSSLFGNLTRSFYLESVLRHPNDQVTAVQYSPDGKLLVSGTAGGRLHLWNMPNHSAYGRLIAEPHGAVMRIDFPPNRNGFLAFYQDGSILAWNLAKRASKTVLGPDRSRTSMAISQNWETMALGGCNVWYDDTKSICREGKIQLRSLQTGLPLGQPIVVHLPDEESTAADMGAAFQGISQTIQSLAFSPDGKALASSAAGGHALYIWDVTTQSLETVLDADGHQGIKNISSSIHWLAFSPDGTTLASADWDNSIVLWDIKEKRPKGLPLKGHQAPITALSFRPDGKMLASASEDRTVFLWNVEMAQAIAALVPGHASTVTSLAFSPDGLSLVSGSRDQTVILWDIISSKAIVKGLSADYPHVHPSPITDLAFSPDNKWLTSVSKEIAILWDLDQGKPYGNPIAPLENKLRTVVGFHPHGRILGHSFYDSKNLVLRSREGLEDYGVTIHHRDIITSMAFSPDGTILATGSVDKTVKLINTALLTPRQSKWMALGYEVEDLESESGKTPSYDKNLLCPPLAGHSGSVNSVAFSPDGKMLASGSDDQSVILWNTVTCTRIGLPLKSHNSRIRTLAFSSKGGILASGSDDRAIVLWDVDTLTRQGKDLTGHSDNVYGLSFSPEGTILASADADGTILLWDVETQQRLGKPLRGHSGAVYSVRFSPDGKMLASAGTDTRILLWDSSYESWRTRGCRIANRNLTEDEWRV